MRPRCQRSLARLYKPKPLANPIYRQCTVSCNKALRLSITFSRAICSMCADSRRPNSASINWFRIGTCGAKPISGVACFFISNSSIAVNNSGALSSRYKVYGLYWSRCLIPLQPSHRQRRSQYIEVLLNGPIGSRR